VLNPSGAFFLGGVKHVTNNRIYKFWGHHFKCKRGHYFGYV